MLFYMFKVNILVNNAGVSQMPQIPFEVEKRLLDINLLGAISLSKAVLPYMKTRKEGQIVVVSSVTGKYGKDIHRQTVRQIHVQV